MTRILVFLMFLPSVVNANCSLMDDPDLRNYCRAKVENDDGLCVLIRDRNMRISCHADIMRDPARCASIIDRQARLVCDAKTEGGS